MPLEKIRKLLRAGYTLPLVMIFVGALFPIRYWIWGAAILLVFVWAFFFNKYWRCPHCGEPLNFRGGGTRCSHCGEELGVPNHL